MAKTALDPEKWPPAMRQLNERQQQFVLAMFEERPSKSCGKSLYRRKNPNHGAYNHAARKAGYGGENPTEHSLTTIGYRIYWTPSVQNAIAEMSKAYLITLGPLAVRRLQGLLQDPDHKDHARAIGMTLDRVSPMQTINTVKVEGSIELSATESAAIMMRIEELAKKFAIPLPQPKVIDGEAIEVIDND